MSEVTLKKLRMIFILILRIRLKHFDPSEVMAQPNFPPCPLFDASKTLRSHSWTVSLARELTELLPSSIAQLNLSRSDNEQPLMKVSQ